jgi:hypothetical protein
MNLEREYLVIIKAGGVVKMLEEYVDILEVIETSCNQLQKFDAVYLLFNAKANLL